MARSGSDAAADGDVVELPECRTLFRQGSVETPLEALEPPPSSSASSSDCEYEEVQVFDVKPRVVDVLLKVTPASPDPPSHPEPAAPEFPSEKKDAQEEKKEEEDKKLKEEAQGENGKKKEEGKEEEKEKDTMPVCATPLSRHPKPAAPEFPCEKMEAQEEKKEEQDKKQKEEVQGEKKEEKKEEEKDEKKEEGSEVEKEKNTVPVYATPLRRKSEATAARVCFLDPGKKPEGGNVGTLRGLSHGTMASPRPKSPRPPGPRKDEKEESFWEKIGTLGRKKRIKEVQEVQQEGKYAIDSPGSPLAPDLPPEEYALEENEERSMIEPRSFDDPKLRELIAVLIEWINDELADQRIIVKDIEEDLYDGQVLQKLLEKLSGQKLDVPEVTQSEEGQKQKLGIVLAAANRVLGHPRWSQHKWSVESIHSKNLVAILHLLVTLARQFRAPVRLPENVAVEVVVVQKRDGTLSHRTVLEEITSTYDELGMRCERDAFDTLLDHAPDKLQVVKKSLVTFVNKHLNKVNLEVTDLDTQFHDGVYLTILMGLLEGFFVPLYSFHLTPQDFEQKVHNVAFAFELMQDVGIAKPKARPEDIVNLDLKSTLRVLYNLFTKYKHMC